MKTNKLKALYDLLKLVDLQETISMSHEEYENSQFCKTLKLSGREGHLIARLLTTMAHECSFKEFTHFYSSNEFPPMKLTSEECSVLYGGSFMDKWEATKHGFNYVADSFIAFSFAIAGDKLNAPGSTEALKKARGGNESVWMKNIPANNAMSDSYEKSAKISYTKMWESWNKKD